MEEHEWTDPHGRKGVSAHQWNVKLAERYGIRQDEYPAFRLFTKGGGWKRYTKNNTDAADFRNWLRLEAGIYVGENVALREIDKIGLEYMQANEGERKDILSRVLVVAEKTVAKAPGLQGVVAAYIQAMSLVAKRGEGFIEKERKRIKRMLNNPSISAEKKKNFEDRLAAVLALDTTVL